MSAAIAWHADDGLLRRYAAGDPLDAGSAASVEAHLIGCGGCRARLAGLGPDPVLERAWTSVVAGVATPRPSPAVRMLRRIGVSEADAVLLRAARSLDGAWTLATLVVIAFAALAAIDGGDRGAGLYLLLAPLVPVAGVVVAFTSVDPLDEITAAAPYSAARLALLRTAAVCATSIPLVVAAGLAVPPIGWLAFAWLVPALALTLLTLAAMTWLSPAASGVGAAALWVAAVGVAWLASDPDAVVAPRSLSVQVVVAVAAAACLSVRLMSRHAPGGSR